MSVVFFENNYMAVQQNVDDIIENYLSYAHELQ